MLVMGDEPVRLLGCSRLTIVVRAEREQHKQTTAQLEHELHVSAQRVHELEAEKEDVRSSLVCAPGDSLLLPSFSCTLLCLPIILGIGTLVC